MASEIELVPETYEVAKPPPKKRQKKATAKEVAAEIETVLAVPEKKAPTEKQLAARERARLKREEKRAAEDQARLVALYAQSEAVKAAEAKAAAAAAKKALAAQKRKEAKEAKIPVLKTTSTVAKNKAVKVEEDEPVMGKRAAKLPKFEPIALPGEYKPVETNIYAKGQLAPFGFDRTGIRPQASTEPVSSARKGVAGRASSGGKGKFGM